MTNPSTLQLLTDILYKGIEGLAVKKLAAVAWKTRDHGSNHTEGKTFYKRLYYQNNINNVLYLFTSMCLGLKLLRFGPLLDKLKLWSIDFKLGVMIVDC